MPPVLLLLLTWGPPGRVALEDTTTPGIYKPGWFPFGGLSDPCMSLQVGSYWYYMLSYSICLEDPMIWYVMRRDPGRVRHVPWLSFFPSNSWCLIKWTAKGGQGMLSTSSFFPIPFAFVFDQSRPPCRLLPFFFSLKPLVKIIKHLSFLKKNNNNWVYSYHCTGKPIKPHVPRPNLFSVM